MTHPAALPPEALLRECEVARTRRGGPGGQHRNKVETAVVVRHLPTGLTGQASERRSQDMNRQAALHRLRVNLALEVRTAIAPQQAADDLWRQRVRGGRIAASAEHADFPELLATALDRLAACEWNVSAAAGGLGVTTSQLVRFLQIEARAMQLLNLRRQERGLGKLQ
jgi:hypothetical protein